MRIAISGTHFSGKLSLVQALSEALPKYTTVDEPYHLLQEEGYEFAELPSIEDFELQLERAIESLDETLSNVIFDRCPADILCYLLSHTDAEAFNLEEWLPRVQTAIKKLYFSRFLTYRRARSDSAPAVAGRSVQAACGRKATRGCPGEYIRLRGGCAGGFRQSADTR